MRSYQYSCDNLSRKPTTPLRPCRGTREAILELPAAMEEGYPPPRHVQEGKLGTETGGQPNPDRYRFTTDCTDCTDWFLIRVICVIRG
jgi:hypothetical protein